VDYRAVGVEIDGEQVAFFVRRDSPYVHGGVPLTNDEAGQFVMRLRKE
jgi:hypothetical protein